MSSMPVGFEQLYLHRNDGNVRRRFQTQQVWR